MSKTHFKKAFNTPYLGSQNLPDYKDINLIIERVELRESKGLKENSKFNIAYFTDVNVKPMLLNAGNSKIVSKLADSPYIEDWINIEVTITVKKVKAFGDHHDALRIREVTRKTSNLPTLNESSKKWDELVLKVFNGSEREIISKYYNVSDEIWDEIIKKGLEIQKAKLEQEEKLQLEEEQKLIVEQELLDKAKELENKGKEEKIDKFLDEK
jgi:hypothetical protein